MSRDQAIALQHGQKRVKLLLKIIIIIMKEKKRKTKLKKMKINKEEMTMMTVGTIVRWRSWQLNATNPGDVLPVFPTLAN